MRKGFPIVAGSDDRRQPEKIDFFGSALGSAIFCKIPIDGVKWGKFLFEMGVKSESVPALNKQATAAAAGIAASKTIKRDTAEYCQQVRENPTIARFTKQP